MSECITYGLSRPHLPTYLPTYPPTLQAQYPDIISDVRGWGLINGVELSASSGLQAAKVVQAWYVCMHVCLYVCMYVYMYVCMFVCM